MPFVLFPQIMASNSSSLGKGNKDSVLFRQLYRVIHCQENRKLPERRYGAIGGGNIHRQNDVEIFLHLLC